MNVATLPGLQIDSIVVEPSQPNFRLLSWPPLSDFPVIVDSKHEVVSRYSDSTWDLSPWAGRTLTINFGDGGGRARKVSPLNASLLRMVVAWWIWGPDAITSARTLVVKFETLKSLFIECTNAGIAASDLSRFPKVIERIATQQGSRGYRALSLLSHLWLSRDELGFVLLDEPGLKLMSSLLTALPPTQTAFIPPRIWTYQVLRLRECIEDYLVNREKVESCYQYCVEAYERNALYNRNGFSRAIGTRTPFSRPKNSQEPESGEVFYGPFMLTAERYGIDQLLNRWVATGPGSGIAALSTYLSLISYTGLAYILNFSLMRVEEASRLRSNCLTVERVPFGDDIHMLSGVTSKTIQDNDARWIVSPSVEAAIQAMRSVAFLRIAAAKLNSVIHLQDEDALNPHLQALPYEPWSPRGSRTVTNSAKQLRNYSELLKMWPKLFDIESLTIRSEDLEVTNRMTFGLDQNRFGIGKVWPLSWHQLRRTGAVNMLASGQVGEASLQYQLKHASRAMTQYYGRNFYLLKAPLNKEARGFYLKEMYQSTVREFESLQSDRFISPHGEKRKEQILSEINEKDHKSLLKDAEAGRISYRQTFLGGCAQPGAACTLGGITNISGCMGYDSENACKWAILDQNKRPLIKQLKLILSDKLKESESGSRLQESLRAQIESAERALNALETA